MRAGGPERADAQGSLYKVIYDERAGLRGARFDRVGHHTDRAGEVQHLLETRGLRYGGASVLCGRGALHTEGARWLIDWVDSSLPAGGSEVRSSDVNPGTLVGIHHWCLVNHGSGTNSLTCDVIPSDLRVN